MSDALKGEAAPLKSLLCFDQERKKTTSSYLPASLELDSQQQWLGSREWRSKTSTTEASTLGVWRENKPLIGRVGRGLRRLMFGTSSQVLDISHPFWFSA